MWYGPSQLSYIFPCRTHTITCLKSRSSSYISMQTTFELYHMVALFLMENAHMWETSLVSSIRSMTHLFPASFSSALNWKRFQEGVSIEKWNTTSSPYTMVKKSSLVFKWWVVWYDRTLHKVIHPKVLWHHLAYFLPLSISLCLFIQLGRLLMDREQK